MAGRVTSVSPADKAGVKRFVALERTLLGASPWLASEGDSYVVKRLTGRSAFLVECDHALFVAADAGLPAARCTAFVNRRYQAAKGEAVGFVGYFAAAPDRESATVELLDHAERWLRDRGVTRVIAPYNFASFFGMALRVDAHDEEPVFPYGWQPAHYASYLRAAGYSASLPMWSYTIDFGSEAFAAAQRQAASNGTVTVRPIDKKRWDQDLGIFRAILNETFAGEWEFYPHSQDEIREFFDVLKPVMDPRQLLIAEVGSEPVGVCWGLPDWNPLLRSMSGKPAAVQSVQFLLRSGRYERAGLLCIAVRPSARGKGVARTLATALCGRYQERGLTQASYFLVNQANEKSHALARSLGGRGAPLYCAFDKLLA